MKEQGWWVCVLPRGQACSTEDTQRDQADCPSHIPYMQNFLIPARSFEQAN